LPAWTVRFDLRINLSDSRLLPAIAKAEALSAVIRGIPMPPAVGQRLDRLNILRAVRGTTGIEGSDLSEDEVGRVLDSMSDAPALPAGRRREELEVRNAARVMEFVAHTLDESPGRPVSQELICELHALTTANIDYSHNSPGRYRSHAVTAGSYVPPRNRDDIDRLMGEFGEWLHSPETAALPALARAVAAHFYLISIHPFGDGNGRTARALESYLLYQARLNACGFYSLSNFYYQRRADYIDFLDAVRFHSDNDLTPFVRFAAEGMVHELEWVHAEILKESTVIAFHDMAREVLIGDGLKATKTSLRMLGLVLGLRDEPIDFADVRRYGPYRNLSPRTAMRDIDVLLRLDLILRRGESFAANLARMDQFRLGIRASRPLTPISRRRKPARRSPERATTASNSARTRSGGRGTAAVRGRLHR
jgi:Fic family protein